MPKKGNGFVNGLLFFIYEGTKLLPIPFESPYQWAHRTLHMERSNFYANLFALEKRGVVRVISKEGKKFIQITQKGELKVLLNKSKLLASGKWDGKWRLIIYDIPEVANYLRDGFRRLLKERGFIKLQSSVFISPYPLNPGALEYLKSTGLIKFIRIIRVDAIDDDKYLRKRFHLSKS